MFKNSLLRYLSFAACFDKDNENGSDVDPKAAAAAERAAIQVDESSSKRPTSSEENNEENNDNEEDDDNEEEEGEEEGEEEQEEENNNNDNEETEEQKTARIAQEKEERKQARQQRKWDRLAAERDEQRRRADAAEAKLKEQPVDGLTEEEVERRAEEKAAQKLALKEQENKVKQIEKNIEKLEVDANKIDPKFNEKVTEFVKDIGQPIPLEVIDVLADLDNANGGAVLNYLTDNIDEAEDIFDLKSSPHKLAVKLIRISDKLKGEAKPAAKIRQRSNVPDPISPVGEGRNDPGNGPLTGKESMDDFARKREKQVEERRRVRGY